jgi:hypothetical protein
MMNNATNWLQTLEGLLPWIVIVVVALAAIAAVVVLVLDLLDTRRLLRQKAVFLELTPPANANKTPEATKHLFAVLHGLEASRTLLEKLLRRKVAFALELTSTKQEGIRYVLRVPESDVSAFEQTVLSYLPDAKLRRVKDFLPEDAKGRVLELKQTGHFAYPLHTQLSLGQHDPMAYLTGIMTKLLPDELISFQIVVSPAKVREAGVITNRIMQNEELVYQLGKKKLPAQKVFDGINSVTFGVLDSVGDVASGPSRNKQYQPQASHKQQVAMKIKPARVLSPFELQLAESVHDKLSQPLFRVSVRAFVAMSDKQSEKQRIKGVREWLASLAVPKYQSLRVRHTYLRLQEQYRLFVFQHRLPAFFSRNTCVLSAAELADLYHFPHSETAKTENVVKSLSKTLPAPLSLKNGAGFDVVLGRNHHHGTTTNIGLTAPERERHIYIIGGTGNGKTTMIEYGIVQDIKNGKGVAVVDPHGDLAERLLRHIPEDRIKDVIYFNPADLSYPIGLNLLELPEGLTGDDLLDAKDFITEAVVSVMRKIFSEDDSGGHRIEYVLRNAVQTALTLKDPTLFTIFDLLTDTKYRNKIAKNLQNPKLKNFWKNEFGKAGDFQRVKMAGGVTAKIGRFQFSASAERIMSQPRSTINFEEILDGKILICNFAKGLIGEDTSELFGISTLAKLQLAAYRRVRTKQDERKPFYLYVDEFQNFATMSFVQMLSEARKYKVFLTMAEQSTSQQEDLRMVNTILANVGTVICFRSGNPADERLMLPLFRPYIEEGEIANLPTYNFYARVSAILSQEPVSGETIVLKDKGSEDIAQSVVAASRRNYTKKYESKATEEKNDFNRANGSIKSGGGKPQDSKQ